MVFSATFLGLPVASLVLRDALEFSTSGVALLLGGASIAVVLSEFPWGIAADRYGERRVLLVGVGGTMVALCAVAVFSLSPPVPVWGITVLLFFAAAAGGAVTGPSGSAILGWFGEHRHGTLLSLRVAAVPAGGAIGTLVYAWLLSRWGPSATFAVFAVACAACALLIWVFVLDPPRTKASPNRLGTGGERFPPALRKLSVWRVASSGLLLDVSQFLVLTFAATILADQHRLDPSVGVAVVAGMQLLGGALRVAIGVGTDVYWWMSRSLVVRSLALTQVASLGLFAFGQSLALTVSLTAVAIAGVASCAWQGAHFAQIAHFAGREGAGSALGLNNAATSLGAFIPQVAAGAVAAAWSWAGAVVLLGVIPALLAVFLFPTSHRADAAGASVE